MRLRGAARRTVVLAAAVAAALASAVATAGPASAHPLGNFTVNRYARVEISAGVARVYYVLDEAEIPAFQEGHAVDADPVAFGRARADDINRHLSLAVDGAAVPLTVERTDLSRPPGQGGLRTLRLAVLYTATVAPGATAHAATFADGNEPDRIGWREIVVTARGDGAVRGSTAPAQDLSDELRKYPANAVQAPLDLRRATFTFTPGTIAVAALPIARTAAAPSRAGGRFAGLVARRGVTPGVLAGMLGLALLFGAAHALAPGHGKTVMAAYMVGSEGRPVDAVFLGGAVSLMHTASAIVLGLVLFAVSRSVPVDRVYPALTLVSGVAVVVVGAVLLRSRLRVARRAGGGRAGGAGHGHVHADDPDGASSHAGEHSHDGAHTPEPGHPHGHGHAHGHGHSHVHAPIDEPVAPMSRGGLMVLAGSGGIVPSPSAVIVLVSAFSLGRPGLGLALVAAFSVGLAATLTGVGIALVAGRSMARRRGYLRSLRLMPPAGAAVLVVLGLALAAQGIRGMG